MTLFIFLIGTLIFCALGAILIFTLEETLRPTAYYWLKESVILMCIALAVGTAAGIGAAIQYQVTWDNRCEAAGGYGSQGVCLDTNTNVIRVKM